MSDLASLIAQLSGGSQQAAADPAMAAVRQARATIDALMLKLGQSIDARVTGQLPLGLTQLSAGKESLVLKLATPVPTGAAVTIRVSAAPNGAPTVTVSLPNAAPQVAQPLPLPATTMPLVQAQAGQPPASPATPSNPPARPIPQPTPQAIQLPLPPPPVRAAPAPPSMPAPVPSGASGVPVVPANPAPAAAAPLVMASTPQPPATASPLPQPGTAPLPQPAGVPATPLPMPAPAALPAPGQPALQVPLPVAPPATQPTAPPVVQPAAQPATAQAAVPVSAEVKALPAAPLPAPAAGATPVAATASAAAGQPPASPAIQPGPAPLLSVALATQPVQPIPVHASPYPAHVPHVEPGVVAQQLPLATARQLAPLNLADPAQAAARQDSSAPLLARLAAVVTAVAPVLPPPLMEVARRVLASRLDLNRMPPDGKALETAVLRSGVLQAPPTRQATGDSREALLTLRSGLAALLGNDGVGPVAPVSRPAPPIRGEPPRAPEPQPLGGAAQPADGEETVRTLLGQTDATLSRLKLLQSASQPPADARPDAAPRGELRVEIPVVLGAETGVLQLLVERDARQPKRTQRERGWRMRFAMNFSETGEVGADIAMLGRAASVSIWAADPVVADALDAMLPELGPAIQRHGLELTSLRVRRGTPRSSPAAPGQLLDSAR